MSRKDPFERPLPHQRREIGLMLGMGLIVLVIATAWWRIMMMRETDLVRASARTVSVVVQPGDTLWGLGGRLGLVGNYDTRLWISEVGQLNGWPADRGHTIHPGDLIVLPDWSSPPTAKTEVAAEKAVRWR